MPTSTRFSNSTMAQASATPPIPAQTPGTHPGPANTPYPTYATVALGRAASPSASNQQDSVALASDNIPLVASMSSLKDLSESDNEAVAAGKKGKGKTKAKGKGDAKGKRKAKEGNDKQKESV